MLEIIQLVCFYIVLFIGALFLVNFLLDLLDKVVAKSLRQFGLYTEILNYLIQKQKEKNRMVKQQ